MDFPTVRELSRRKNAVRVLKFLLNAKEEQNFTDIYTALDMNDCTVLYWLKRLESFGIIESVRSRVNLHSKYYYVRDKEGAQRIIDKYHQNIAFKLARLIPYTKTAESQIREDRRFRVLCEEHYLTIDEGIKVVKNCAKIGVEKSYLYRKSQGYDEPEKTREQILEEAKKAIG